MSDGGRVGPFGQLGLLSGGALVLAAFLSSGMLKGESSPLGIDLTALLAALLLGFVVLRRHQLLGARPVIELSVLFFLFALPILWTDWFDYSRTKVLHLFTLTLLAAFAPTILLTTRRQLQAFFMATLLIGSFVIVSGVRSQINDPTQLRAAALGASTIALGQIVGTVALILVVWQQGQRGTARVGALVLVGLCGIFLLASGSRSSLVALAVAAVAILALNRTDRARTALVVGGLVAGFVLALLVLNQFLPESSLARVVDLLNGIDNGGADIRAEYARKTLARIPQFPFGEGWGAFAMVLEGTTDRAFPHNLLLEITYEAGWLTGGAFLLLVFAALRRSVRAYRELLAPEYLCLSVLILFNFVASCVTGEVNDSRWLFALVGAGLCTNLAAST